MGGRVESICFQYKNKVTCEETLGMKALVYAPITPDLDESQYWPSASEIKSLQQKAGSDREFEVSKRAGSL